MRLLDLYCGAGGAGKGYADAGFEVTGVDANPQPYYPFDFVQSDAIEYVTKHGHLFDVIHASPPCQAHSTLTKGTWKGRPNAHRDLIPATRDALKASGVPWVIENVASAPLRKDLMLCGEMFGLRVIRHRFFELSAKVPQPEHIKHRSRVRGWNHGKFHDGYYWPVYGGGGGKGDLKDWQQAMGMDWVPVKAGIAEAIPPAYTEYIGKHLIELAA